VGAPARKRRQASCVTNTPTGTEVWCCTRDEGRPFEVGSQVQASNRCKLRPSKAAVVSVAETSERDSGRYDPKRRASEPSMKCRNALDDVETGGGRFSRDKHGGSPGKLPVRHPAFRRREVGSGSCMERENLSSRCKGRRPSGRNRKDQSTDAGHRGGAVRIRVESPVMGPDRRGCVVQPWPRANR